MTGKDLFDSLEFLGDDLIYNARFSRSKRSPWRRVLSTAAVLAMLLTGGALLVSRYLPFPVQPPVQSTTSSQELPQAQVEDIWTVKQSSSGLTMQVPKAVERTLEVDVADAMPFRLWTEAFSEEVWLLDAVDRRPDQTPETFTDFSLWSRDLLLGWDKDHFYVLHFPVEQPTQPDSFRRQQLRGYAMLLDFLQRNGLTPAEDWEQRYAAGIQTPELAVPYEEIAALVTTAPPQPTAVRLSEGLLVIRLSGLQLQFDPGSLELTHLTAAEGENALLPCPAEDVPGFWKQALNLPEDWVLQDQTPLQGEPCIWYTLSKRYPVPGTEGLFHPGEQAVLIVDRETGALRQASIKRLPPPIWQPDRAPLTRDQALDAISDLLLPYGDPILGTELCFFRLHDGPYRLIWKIDAAQEVTQPEQTAWDTYLLDAYTGELLDSSRP